MIFQPLTHEDAYNGMVATTLGVVEALMKERKMSDLTPCPVGKRVLLVKEEAPETSEGGIVLVDSAREKPLTARVRAIGDGVTIVTVGEEVIYPAFAGTEFVISGREVIVLDEEDIMLVLRECGGREVVGDV